MADPTPSPPDARGSFRVLVVDDSAANQAAMTSMLTSDGGVEVVASAGDGEEALRRALALEPDCICLDLQMPRMDGFTFLRLLMATKPTPVIVVSSNSRKQDVFKALELGALEFVAKPDPEGGAADLERIRDELLRKVWTIRRLRALPPEDVAPDGNRPGGPPTEFEGGPATPPVSAAAERDRVTAEPVVPARLVAIGASTGGPGAVARLLGALPRDLPVAFAVAQHMPERFTTSFAARLARSTGLDVREAVDGDELVQGAVLIAPGAHHLKIVRVRGAGPTARLLASVVPHDPRDGSRYCPSVDLLFESAAQAMGDRVCAVVLTGMGSDGCEGVARVKESGGLALAESEQSAVIYGMPKQAAGTGKVDEVLPLEEIVERVRRFATA